MLIASKEYIEPAFGLYSSGINTKALTLLSADTSNQGAPPTLLRPTMCVLQKRTANKALVQGFSSQGLSV